MAFWLPQTIQKRLLLYVVQQISVLSNVDLSNLNVSLGSSSRFSFDDLNLAVDEINIPNLMVRSGSIKHLDLQLTVSGGVSIRGNGLLFVVKPTLSENFSDSGSFSLAKSIQDLTTSIMQLPELSAVSDSRNFDGDFASETSNSPGTNSSSSISSSGDEIESVPTVGTIESMKNKILNVALSKLTIVIENIHLRFLFDEKHYIDVNLDKIELNTEENNVRKVRIKNFKIAHIGARTPKVPCFPCTNNMTNSMSYSQSEVASIYMSAMEGLEANEDDERQDFVLSDDLIIIDGICISFEGLSSVDDLSLRDLSIDVDNIHLKVENILGLSEPILDFLLRSIPIGCKNTDSQASSLTGYKRFQKEQDIFEGIAFTSAKIQETYVELAENVKLSLHEMSLNRLGIKEQTFMIDSYEIVGDGLHSVSSRTPMLHGFLKHDEIVVSLLDTIILNLDVAALSELLLFSQRIQDFASLLESKLVRKPQKKAKPTAERKISINAEPIVISINLGGYKLSLSTERIFSDLSYNIFRSNSIKIERRHSSDSETIIILRDVSLVTSKSRIQLKSFDENLNDSLLTSKIMAKCGEVIFEDNYKSLQQLCQDLQDLGPIFGRNGQTKNEGKKKAYLKRSVRILHSSNIIYKHTELASFALILDSCKVKIKNFFSIDFGNLDTTISSILFAITGEGNFIGFCKDLFCNRFAHGIYQTIIGPIKSADTDKPLFYFQKKTTGKMRMTLRNLSFHYYAKWLDIFRNSNSTTSTKLVDGPHLEQSWELKLIDSSFILHPYRLEAALVVVVDRMVCNGKYPALQMRSVLKSGTLLLIDDTSNIKTQEKKHCASLLSYYAHQGFSAIGKLDTIIVQLSNDCDTMIFDIRSQSVGLSLCADSAHTFTQLCIDLKFPLTFPDNKKYSYNVDTPVDVFKDVDPHFFSSSHIKEEPKSYSSEEEDLIHVESSFFDEVRGPDSSGSQHEDILDDSSSDSTSRTIRMQETYLDSSHEKNGPAIEANKLIGIILKMEATKISVKLFDGYDWKYTRKSISRTIDQVDREIKSFDGEHNPNSRLEMTVFDSIYISANMKDAVDLKKRVNDEVQGEVKSPVLVKKANLHPSRHYKASILLEDLQLTFTGYSVDEPTRYESDGSADQLNKCELSVKKFEVIDNVPTSTWNKFITLLRHEQWPLDRPMIRAEVAMVRPVDFLAATELILNVEIAPLRLHVDQDALDFLVKFGEFKDNRFELIDDYPDTPFIQKLTTNSVKLKLDYKPKKVDYSGLRSGHTSELMNFFILDGANITLKGIALYGINGFPELNTTLKAVWTPDITYKQLPGVLEGFAPVKSILALGSGVKALVTVPLAEYKQDRRLGRGLRRGCNVFVRTATGDFVKLGAKLASGTQAVLENTEELLGGGGSTGRLYKAKDGTLDMENLLEEDQLVGGTNPKIKGQRPAALVIDPSDGDEGEPKIVSLYADQPLDLHEGLEEAYLSLEKHMHLVYDVVWRTKGEIKETKAGAAAAAVSVAKVAPVAIIRPLIGATEAVAKALQGISNQFDKEQIYDMHDKYKAGNRRK